ncbi:MAG: response regulator transcription factor [Lachnospiraceae bacterium]|nr:response regulator transcription factor [Lachnospiraceae bacterium]
MSLIYVVEDDENIREIVLYALESAGFSAHGFESGADLMTAAKKEIPDLVLMDIMLPGEDGLSILEKLRSSGQTEKLPVIMLTAKGSEFDKVKGLNMGADDYVTKPFGVMELISRVKALLRRTAANVDVTDNCLKYEDILIDTSRRLVTVADEVVNLTYKEYELLYYLVLNKELVLSRNKIMEAIWGFDFEGESRTLDMHIRTLRQKLKDAKKYIHTVRNVGYRFGLPT